MGLLDIVFGVLYRFGLLYEVNINLESCYGILGAKGNRLTWH